jgi:hypothetical protein
VSKSALVMIAPVFTCERFNDPAWARPGRTMYAPGSLKLLPNKTSVPLLVDHDEEREIGVVHRFGMIDWNDGPWIYASATVDDPPSWLERRAPASFCHHPYDRREVTIRDRSAEVVYATFVDEVSVLSRANTPAEPRAHAWVFDEPTKPSPVEVIHHPPGGVLVRRNLGKVLAVGGVRLRGTANTPRTVGRSIVIDRADGSQLIYHDEAEYRADVRAGLVG